MINLDDISWSGIVNQIQHDKKIGANMLVAIAQEKEEIDKKYSKIKSELERTEARQEQLKHASLSVLRHLQLDTPLAVTRKGFIVVVSDSNITIEKNIL